MKTRAIIVLIFIWIIILLLDTQVNAQVYSSWASTQIRHTVEVEKPKVKYDTIQSHMPFQMEIKNIFIYKDFTIDIVHSYGKVRLAVYTGTSVFILKPDDEYVILEKLIPLTK